MGALGAFLEGFAHGVSGSNKINIDNFESGDCDMYYNCTVKINDPLTTDDAYLNVFSDVLRQLKREKPHDAYIASILQSTPGVACRAVESGSMQNQYPRGYCVWRVFFRDNSEGDNSYSILLRLRTPNTEQLDRSGNIVKSGSGYVIDRNHETPDHISFDDEDISRLREEQRKEQKKKDAERMARPNLDTFLGIKFIDDIRNIRKEQNGYENQNNGLYKYEIEANNFLSFDSCFAFVPEDDYKIVGIGCSKNTECMSEQEISELKEVILSILKEKYKRPIEQSCNGYIIYFYEDEVVGDNIKNTIYVSYNEKTISISAFDYKEVNNASLYHLKKNDKQRMYKEALSAL